MIEVESKIINQHLSILIYSRASHSYIDRKIVEIFHLKKRELKISCFIQVATRTKRMINKTIRYCPKNMNGVNTSFDFNIIPLGSIDILIGMHWLDKNHVVLDC
jgi:hypothetical protein